MCEPIEKAINRGRAEGRALERTENRSLWIMEGRISALSNLMANAHISAEKAMDLLGITGEDPQSTPRCCEPINSVS